MRLINARTLDMVEFFGDDIPLYAILSHTWGTEEVAFRDMDSPARSAKQGFRKILEACRLADKRGLEWVWIDTCCIDKSSSAELTESINSMFQFYQNSAVCFVFLSDYSVQAHATFNHCRWFTRGWTLQELLAPRAIEFYDRDFLIFGTKASLGPKLSTLTMIPVGVVDGSEPLWGFTIAQRMSWAALRKTTRIEDRAYSLLGLFDIYMPLIYGEGVPTLTRRNH